MADGRAQTELTPFGPQDCWTQIGSHGAERYERELVPLFRPWTERLVDAAAPKAGERVLDVACGTGIAARIAAPRLGAGGSIAGIVRVRTCRHVATRRGGVSAQSNGPDDHDP